MRLKEKGQIIDEVFSIYGFGSPVENNELWLLWVDHFFTSFSGTEIKKISMEKWDTSNKSALEHSKLL